MALYGAAIEYGLHTLLCLARVAPGASPSARDLAEFQRLPVPFVRKLLTRLAAAGLISGEEGLRGGWRLARPAGEISFAAVVDALQPDGQLFECREIRRHCALWTEAEAPAAATTGVCAIHAAMLSAQAAMRRELSRHTLADMTAQVAAKTRGNGGALSEWFHDRFAQRRQPQEGESDD